jgi:hypothetical protein
MKHTPVIDTQSPWYEAFTPASSGTAARWQAGTERQAPAAEPARPQPANPEDQWATEALFDYYNGE